MGYRFLQIRHAVLRSLGARVGQKIVQYLLNTPNLLPKVVQDFSVGMVLGKILADNLDRAGNARQRVANFMRHAGGQLPHGRQVLRLHHFRIVDTLAVIAELSPVLGQRANFILEGGSAVGRGGNLNQSGVAGGNLAEGSPQIAQYRPRLALLINQHSRGGREGSQQCHRQTQLNGQTMLIGFQAYHPDNSGQGGHQHNQILAKGGRKP